jgi:hypothetical protein
MVQYEIDSNQIRSAMGRTESPIAPNRRPFNSKHNGIERAKETA